MYTGQIMTHYLIEIRLYGPAKRYLKNLIWEIAKKFRVTGAIKRRPVPHITLVGSFTTYHVREVVKEVEQIGKKFNPIPFQIKGFNSFVSTKGQRVLSLNIKPSKELKELRWGLAQRLAPLANLKEYDKRKEFLFHATVAFKDIDKKFYKIFKYIEEKEGFDINTHMLRICIIRNSKIFYEYDLHLHRLLNREKAKNRSLLTRELAELYEEPVKISLDNKNIDKVFLTGDLHLNHANIIRYCNRPFYSAREMNKTLVHNWNRTVKKDDTVFFLGDLAFGRNKGKICYWLNKLNGRVFLIRGNHDRGNLKPALYFDRCIITYKGTNFLLIHDPDKVANWNGWTIHGHHHNNHLEKYPFINRTNKTINVSVELTDYKPISLGSLLDSLDLR